MKTVILLHGALGSKEQMLPLSNLLEKAFQVSVFDFEGHGIRSNSIQEFSIKMMTEDLENFIMENHIESPIVFGYSMGGYVALYHALLFPGKIKKIITLATKFDWTIENSEKEVNQLNVEKMKEKIPDFVNILKQRHGGQWEKVVLKTAAMMLDLGKSKLLNENNLPKINTDVVLCLGDRDKMVSLAETENVIKLLPNGILKVLADTTHPFEILDYKKLVEVF